MAKFRKKPVVIEAVQLTDYSILETIEWIAEYNQVVEVVQDEGEYVVGLKIPTLEGVLLASIGDYIVKGNSPELGDYFWPVKPDYFEQSYEAVED